MKNPLTLILIIFLISIFSSCATFKVKYDKPNKNWKTTVEQPTSKLEHTLFLIGDAGNSKDGNSPSPALATLEKHLAQANKNSNVIFLGDNIYPYGMPPKGEEKDRIRAENRLNAQLNILQNYQGKPFFIPGNHDWIKHGLKGVRRQEKYIEEKLNTGIEDEDEWENYFLPDNGCSGPELIEVNENLAYVIIDSNWYLRKWDKDVAINDGCGAKNRLVFNFLFEEMLRKNRKKNVVVLMHHPMYSYGQAGGGFTAKQHLFPLTDVKKNLYVPLPVLGTMAAVGRSVIGSRQDLAHPMYRKMKKALLAGAGKNGSFIFAAGHEHNLQFIEDEKNSYIVSGAGSKVDAVKMGKGSEFAYGGQGFSKIEFYEDGTAWVEFWKASENNENGELIFRKKIKDKLEVLEEKPQPNFLEFEEHKKTETSLMLTRPVKKRSKFGTMFLGKHHRETYATPFDFKVLDLSKFNGGLHPIKRGGGGQTNSIRLADTLGREYSLRDMTKDASRFIPYPFNQMDLAGAIVEDSYLATFPFAPIVIPKMADAVKVYHTNPELFYVPKQPALGIYNDEFGGTVYMLEERPMSAWKNSSSFGNPLKILNTDKLVSKITKNNHHKVDQEWALRTRIFDVLIGDFDRHDDQWRWSLVKDENGEKLYRPIPRDRDQPFSNYDGVFTFLMHNTIPFLKLLQPYKPNVGNIKWAVYNGRIFDNSFLGEMDWENWKRQVEFIQTNLTDEIIDDAFDEMPKDALKISGNDIKATLKKRRDNMMEIAKKHYNFLAKRVDVYGTEKKELFEIQRLSNGDVDIKVYDSNKKGDKQKLVYHRLFIEKETQEINIYGLGDDDIFNITGEAKKSIYLRVIGGLGKDVFNDSSKVKGRYKETWVYDSKEGNTLNLGTEAKNKTSNHRDHNIYDRENIHYEYNFFTPTPILGVNIDDGFVFGGSLRWVRHEFKKFPYASIHLLSGTVALEKSSLDITYDGTFIDAFGKTDLVIESRYHGNRFGYNFFGIGNETSNLENNENEDLAFNRVQSRLIELNPSVRKLFARGNGELLFGGLLRQIEIDDSENRFISNFGNENPEIFDARLQLGLKFQLHYTNLDHLVMPRSGIKFHTNLSWENDVLSSDVNFGKIESNLALFYTLDKKQRITLASKVGFQHNIGRYQFYDGAIIGGTIAGSLSNLRGFRAERFTGNTSFFQNTELRLCLVSSTNRVLPYSFGIHGGFDYGRVWVDEENSDKWHAGYGGGMWFSPADILLFRLEYFTSTEENLIVFGTGFAF